MRSVMHLQRLCVVLCLQVVWSGTVMAGQNAAVDEDQHNLLLGSVDCAPATACWTVGAVDSAGRMPFRVEWGGCCTQMLPSGVLLSAPGQVMTQQAGEPQLPAVATLLHGIRGGGVKVESAAVAGWVTYTNLTIVPVSGIEASYPEEGPVWHSISRPDPRIYKADEFWPGSLVSVQEIWQGTQRMVRVECRLLCYNPARMILKVARRLDGILSFDVHP